MMSFTISNTEKGDTELKRITISCRIIFIRLYNSNSSASSTGIKQTLYLFQIGFFKTAGKKYTSSLWRFISWDLRITLILNYIAEFVKVAGRDLIFLSGFLKSRVMHFSLVRFSHLLMKIWYILCTILLEKLFERAKYY